MGSISMGAVSMVSLLSYLTGPDHCNRYWVGQNRSDTAEGSVQRREAPISPREAWKSVEKCFHLHFSVIRIGSRGTFVLCTASSRCKRIAGPAAAMCFFLALISLAQRNTYLHVARLDCGLVPKPFGSCNVTAASYIVRSGDKLWVLGNLCM